MDEVFSQQYNHAEAIEEWEEKRLEELCVKTLTINWRNNLNKDFEYIDLTAVSRDTLKIENTVTITAENAPSRAKKIVNNQDVIFATTRPTLKRVTIINEELSDQVCSTGFVVLRGNRNRIKAKWIFYFLQSNRFIKRMEEMQRGTSYPAVTDKDVKDSLIPLPKMHIQQEIIHKLDDLNFHVDSMIHLYKSKLGNLDELKKSILQKAFNGELT